MDLFRPAGMKAIDGETYGCMVVDTEAENIHVKGLQHKEANQTLEALKLYMQEHPGSTAEICTDNRSEWKGAFEKFCSADKSMSLQSVSKPELRESHQHDQKRGSS